MTEKLLSVVMPFVNNVQFTLDALKSLKTEHKFKLLLLDNGSTDGSEQLIQSNFSELSKDWNIISADYVVGNKSVAESWNYGINESKDADYIFIVNNDVLLHPRTIDNLILFIEKTDYAMVTARNLNDGQFIKSFLPKIIVPDFDPEDLKPITNWREEGPDFSGFLIRPSIVDKIGYFDENFWPAYFEDNDMATRIHKAGLHAKRVSTAPYYHYGSTTVNNNPAIKKLIQNGTFEKCKKYFIEKWGNMPSEVLDELGYDYPFNDSSKPLWWWKGCEKYGNPSN